MNFEQHVIDTLDKIDNKLDTIQDVTIRQDEKIKQNIRDIEDVKKNIIPESVKNSQNRLLKFLYAGGFMWAMSIIGFLLKIYIFS